VVSALVSGVVAYLVALVNRTALLEARDEQTRADQEILKSKIDADFKLALKRVDAETAASLNERAWVDYELRRDAYIRLAQLISCLFEGGEALQKPEFHRVARQVRLVGSDEVVAALNAMTGEIKAHGSDTEQRYRALFNAMRRDIRKIHSLPPEGTDLGEEAFPIES
jgi:hypothetical protein